MDDKIVDILRDDIKEIKSDIKILLGLKNKVYGFVIGVSAIISVACNLLLK